MKPGKEPSLITFGLVLLLIVIAATLGTLWPLLIALVGAGPTQYFLDK